MLSIRFVRKGKKKHPLYRVIVQNKISNPQSKYLENVGTYNPHTKETELKKDRIEYWIGQGAQPTDTVHNLLVTNGIVKDDKVRASKSKPGKKKAAEISAKKAEDEAKKAEEATKEVEAAPVEENKEEEKPTEDVKPEEAPVEEKVDLPAQAGEKKE
jgi:small subunit ribosomal protein S16